MVEAISFRRRVSASSLRVVRLESCDARAQDSSVVLTPGACADQAVPSTAGGPQ